MYVGGRYQKEIIMRKIILTFVGAALVAGSTAQVAFAKERHHIRNMQQYNSERFRNTNAHYAAPRYLQPGASTYSGEDGAWQTMTGFGG
jgi:hypothetical protein